MIVSVRLCPRAAAGSDELGSREIIDSAEEDEEDPGAVGIDAAEDDDDDDEETGAGWRGRPEEADCCSSPGVVLVTRATEPRLEGAAAESSEQQLLS